MTAASEARCKTANKEDKSAVKSILALARNTAAPARDTAYSRNIPVATPLAWAACEAHTTSNASTKNFMVEPLEAITAK